MLPASLVQFFDSDPWSAYFTSIAFFPISYLFAMFGSLLTTPHKTYRPRAPATKPGSSCEKVYIKSSHSPFKSQIYNNSIVLFCVRVSDIMIIWHLSHAEYLDHFHKTSLHSAPLGVRDTLPSDKSSPVSINGIWPDHHVCVTWLVGALERSNWGLHGLVWLSKLHLQHH